MNDRRRSDRLPFQFGDQSLLIVGNIEDLDTLVRGTRSETNAIVIQLSIMLNKLPPSSVSPPRHTYNQLFMTGVDRIDLSLEHNQIRETINDHHRVFLPLPSSDVYLEGKDSIAMGRGGSSEKASEILLNIAEEKCPEEHTRSAQRMIEGEFILKVDNRKEKTDKFSQGDHQSDDQRGTLRGENKHGTNTKILSEHVTDEIGPHDGQADIREDRKPG